MKRFVILMVLTLVSVFAALPRQAMAEETGASSAAAESGFEILKGQWVRPDGGYTISISDVDSDGRLDAAYANPRPLPFAEARAKRDGKTIRLFFELRAGGYNGSTYTLAYDPKKDILYGVYYQANARQKYNIYFNRSR